MTFVTIRRVRPFFRPAHIDIFLPPFRRRPVLRGAAGLQLFGLVLSELLLGRTDQTTILHRHSTIVITAC